MLVLDFETEAIVGNPTVCPPRPVGLAYKRPGAVGEYLAWGHPNTPPEQAQRALTQAKNLIHEAIISGEHMLFHNNKFDVSVMGEHLGLQPSSPGVVEDTLYQIFLHDPYADTFSLKPSSERILGWKPEEQNALYDWIVANVRCTRKEAGAYIARAPVELVAPYAIGDVERTFALYEHLSDKIPKEAYEREKSLCPILIRGERRGIRVDVESLESDLLKYEKSVLWLDRKVWMMLGGTEFNIESSEELANALDKNNAVTGWVSTPTGLRSTARENLLSVIKDPELGKLLTYRGALSHCLSNFYRPWLRFCKDSPSGDRMHPEWQQVRQMRGESNDTKGTRTGRLSCTNPNFQNPPNEYELEVPQGFLPLPFMRKYLLPEEGAVWCKRDYSQQELRILAHYTEGRLYSAYRQNPRIDAHETCQDLIRDLTGINLIRKYVKITGFSMIYGSGVPGLARQLGVPEMEAKKIKDAYLAAMPEVGELMRSCQLRGRSGQSIRTWGGRLYPVEPPKIINEAYRSFDYKLLNYLIQGSAADCTKEAIIRWDSNRGSGVFACTVHDEVNISSFEESDMRKLREAMESIEFDVPMLTDGFRGDSWYELDACE